MKSSVENVGGRIKLALAGSIDEDADFTQIKIPATAGVNLDVELRGVSSINSCGIREWIKFFSSSNFSSITFYECPKVVVDQMNIVQGFLPPRSEIISFYVPYFHEESGSEKSILFSLGKEFDATGQLSIPAVKDDGGNDMEMDVIENKYFKFIKKSA